MLFLGVLSDEDTTLPASKRRNTNKDNINNDKEKKGLHVLTELEIKKESIDESGSKDLAADDTPQENTNCDFVAFEEEDTCKYFLSFPTNQNIYFFLVASRCFIKC